MPSPARARVTSPNAGRRIARKAAAQARPAARPRGTATTGSPRYKATRAELGGHLRRLFAEVQPITSFGMDGWRIPRPRKVEWTHGTIDPNYLHVFLAERAAGISLHVWSPVGPPLSAREREFTAAGFKVLVGCLQYDRKGDFPVGAVVPFFEELAGHLAKDGEADAGGPAPGRRRR